MKKLVLLVAVIASVSMISCTTQGNTSASASASASVDTTTVEEVDTTKADTTAVAEVADKAVDAAKDAVDPAAEQGK